MNNNNTQPKPNSKDICIQVYFSESDLDGYQINLTHLENILENKLSKKINYLNPFCEVLRLFINENSNETKRIQIKTDKRFLRDVSRFSLSIPPKKHTKTNNYIINVLKWDMGLMNINVSGIFKLKEMFDITLLNNSTLSINHLKEYVCHFYYIQNIKDLISRVFPHDKSLQRLTVTDIKYILKLVKNDITNIPDRIVCYPIFINEYLSNAIGDTTLKYYQHILIVQHCKKLPAKKCVIKHMTPQDLLILMLDIVKLQNWKDLTGSRKHEFYELDEYFLVECRYFWINSIY